MVSYMSYSAADEGRLTVGSAFRDWALATPSTYSDAVDDITLLSFITKAASFVRTGRSRCAVDDIQLSKLY